MFRGGPPHARGKGRRVRNYPAAPVVSYVTIVEDVPLNFAPTDTYQLTALVESAEIALNPGDSPSRITITGRTVTWESSDTGKATVNASGLVSAIAVGNSNITAICDGVRSPSKQIVVTEPQNPVASVVVTPSSGVVLSVGGQTTLQARAKDAGGNDLPGQTITWQTSNGTVLTVGSDSGDENHQVTINAVSTGTANVTATCTSADPDVVSPNVGCTVNSSSAFWVVDFDSGSLGGEGGGGWFFEAPNNTAVTSEHKFAGTHSLRFTYNGVADCQDCTAEQRYTMGQQLTELYAGMRLYIPDGTEGLGSAAYTHRDQSGCPSGQRPENNKLMRFWNEDYQSYHVKGGFSFTESGGNSIIIPEYGFATNLSPYQNSGVGSFGLGNSGVVIDGALKGTWVKLVFRVKLASSAGANNGALGCWVNGNLEFEHTAVPWFCDEVGAQNYFRKGYLLGWANSGYTSTTKLYIDNAAWGPTFDSVNSII